MFWTVLRDNLANNDNNDVDELRSYHPTILR